MSDLAESPAEPSTEELWLARVHAAMDRILADPAGSHDLAAVASSVHASPYHFHRVFKQLVGETLHSFQKRVRLERALYAMAHGDRALTDIALELGFSSASAFSRAFKEHYGTSPRAFDLQRWRNERRGELTEGAPYLERLPAGANPDGFQVAIRTLPPRRFAYHRVTDPFQPGRVTGAAEELVAWARAEGVDGTWYGWMFEDPELVPLEQCRYDVAVEIGAMQAVPAPFGALEWPSMTVACVTLRGDIGLEQRALDWIYGTWLPRSGREPGRFPCCEVWHGLPFAHGDSHFELDLHLPLVPRHGG